VRPVADTDAMKIRGAFSVASPQVKKAGSEKRNGMVP
jgi:hypothetical protein